MVKIYDDIYKKEWTERSISLCPHPGVIQKYGYDGVCRVSVYTCKRCRYAIHYKWHGGIRCGYNGETNYTENEDINE